MTPNESSPIVPISGEAGFALRQISDEHRVALLPLAAVGHGEDREPFVFGRLDAVEPLRVGGVLVHQDVGRLRGADLVEIDLVVLVGRREFFALGRRGVAAVEEAAARP